MDTSRDEDDLPYMHPDVEHLENEIAELRSSLSQMAITIDKIYNVVKIIYWDNHRPSSAAPGYKQTVRAVAKPPDLLRHVLTKSHVRAMAQESRADLITGSPPKNRSRCHQPLRSCRVSYDLLNTPPRSLTGPAVGAYSPEDTPQTPRTSSDQGISSLEWSKILPRLLDLGSSRSDGEDLSEDKGVCSSHEVPGNHTGKNLKPSTEHWHEFQTGISQIVPLSLKKLSSRNFQSSASVLEVTSRSYDDPPEAEERPVHSDSSFNHHSETGIREALNPVLKEKWENFLSNAKFSPLKLPKEKSIERNLLTVPNENSLPREIGENPSAISTPELTAHGSRTCGVVAEAACVVKSCSQEGSNFVLVHYQCLLEQRLHGERARRNLLDQLCEESVGDTLPPDTDDQDLRKD